MGSAKLLKNILTESLPLKPLPAAGHRRERIKSSTEERGSLVLHTQVEEAFGPQHLNATSLGHEPKAPPAAWLLPVS